MAPRICCRQGVIVGNLDGRPAVWRAINAQPELLAVPAGAEGLANALGVDENSTIIGTTHSLRPTRALLWHPDGTLDTLPDARVLLSISNGWVTGIDAAGTARWNLRAGVMDPVPRLDRLNALVNAQGWMAGVTSDRNITLVAGDEQLKLSAPPAAPQGQSHVSLLSDDGRTIAGWFGGDLAAEQVVAMPVVWHCS